MVFMLAGAMRKQCEHKTVFNPIFGRFDETISFFEGIEAWLQIGSKFLFAQSGGKGTLGEALDHLLEIFRGTRGHRNL